MPVDPELEQSLADFRKDILKILTDLQAEINALQDAVQEPKPVTKARLRQLRDKAKLPEEKILEHFAQRLSAAQTRR